MPRIYLSNDTSDVTGYKIAYVDMRSPKTTALTTATTTTTSSGDNIAVTDAAGGTALKWITKPFLAAATLATSVQVNIWAKETSAAANSGVGIVLLNYTAAAEDQTLLDANGTVELTTSFAAHRFQTAAATSQAFAAGDRLVVKLQAVAVGTMGAVTGGHVIDYDGPTAGADGDSWIDIVEDFRVNETQPGNGALPFRPYFSTGSLLGIQGGIQRGIDSGLYTADAKVRSALDAVQYEINLQSPRTSISSPA